MQSQLLQLFRGKCSRVTLTLRFLVIDANGISVSGNVKSVDLGSIKVIPRAS